MSDRIELVTPIGRQWDPVIRLVLGGIADRLDLGFEELDDLQLAVERLLADARFDDRVTLSFEILDKSVRLRIGPLLTGAVADALQQPDARPGELTLGRILQTVVDSYGVEKVEDGHMVVRLEKAVRRGG
jgi:hypothetical protein